LLKLNIFIVRGYKFRELPFRLLDFFKTKSTHPRAEERSRSMFTQSILIPV
mgnify:CR=1